MTLTDGLSGSDRDGCVRESESGGCYRHRVSERLATRRASMRLFVAVGV